MRDDVAPGQIQLEVDSTLAMIERLQQDRGYRDRLGLFFVEGVRNFIQAVDHRFEIESLIYSEKLLTNPLARMLVRRLKRAGAPFARASPEQFRAVSKTERASGVGVILHQRIQRLDEVALDDRDLWIALGQVRSPGNLGTLLRTSAAIDGTGLILLGGEIDPFDPALVRATMGALFRQKLVLTSMDQFCRWASSRRVQVICASPDGTIDYDRARYHLPAVLVLGEERRGLTRDQRACCNQMVRIPMVADTDSLNVAVAGSLLLYEVFRSSRRRQ